MTGVQTCALPISMEVGDGKRGVVITKKENVEKEEGKGQNGEEPKSGDRGKEKSRCL